MDTSDAKLIAEQIGRLVDNLESRLNGLEKNQEHEKELNSEKNKSIDEKIKDLKDARFDHENRIRILNDFVQSLKTSQSIGHTLQAVLTLIAASIAAWLGSR